MRKNIPRWEVRRPPQWLPTSPENSGGVEGNDFPSITLILTRKSLKEVKDGEKERGGAGTRQYKYIVRSEKPVGAIERANYGHSVWHSVWQRDSDHSDQIRYLVSTLFITTLNHLKNSLKCTTLEVRKNQAGFLGSRAQILVHHTFFPLARWKWGENVNKTNIKGRQTEYNNEKVLQKTLSINLFYFTMMMSLSVGLVLFWKAGCQGSYTIRNIDPFFCCNYISTPLHRRPLVRIQRDSIYRLIAENWRDWQGWWLVMSGLKVTNTTVPWSHGHHAAMFTFHNVTVWQCDSVTPQLGEQQLGEERWSDSVTHCLACAGLPGEIQTRACCAVNTLRWGWL